MFPKINGERSSSLPVSKPPVEDTTGALRRQLAEQNQQYTEGTTTQQEVLEIDGSLHHTLLTGLLFLVAGDIFHLKHDTWWCFPPY